jgi:hypothetical protein
MPKKHKLFPDVTTISLGDRCNLKWEGLLNDDDTVIGWSRLAPSLRDRKVSEVDAKCLVLIELDQPEPRPDMVRRLVSYLSYSGKEKTMEQIEELLKK